MQSSSKRLLLIYPYKATFIDKDLQTLAEYYQLDQIKGQDYAKSLSGYLKLFLDIGRRVGKADICFAWFADIRTLFTIFWARIYKKKTIVQIGGYETCNLPKFNYGGFRSWSSKRKILYILKHADLLVTFSDFSAREVKHYTSEKSVKVINLGIDIQTPLSKKKRRNLIVTIANATRYKYKLKGLDTFARVATRFRDMEFMIIGDYDKKTKSELLEINPDLRFAGYINNKELGKILTQAKIYCQLSYRESFGMALLEAMSYGCVPVVTDRGALPEVAGKKAFYTEYGNIEQTVTAIRKAENCEDRAGFNRRAREKFPLKKRKQALIQEFEGLL